MILGRSRNLIRAASQYAHTARRCFSSNASPDNKKLTIHEQFLKQSGLQSISDPAGSQKRVEVSYQILNLPENAKASALYDTYIKNSKIAAKKNELAEGKCVSEGMETDI